MSTTLSFTRAFCDRTLELHVTSEIATSLADLELAVASVLGSLPPATSAAPDIVLRVHFVRERVPPPPAGRQLGVGAFECEGGFLMDHGHAWVSVRTGAPHRIVAFIPGPPTPTVPRWSVMIALLLVARQFGCYQLHAGLVDTPQGGWLLVGPSGSGKSTTALALAVSGLVPRADDLVLLDADLRAFPIARPFHLTSRAIEAFPDTTRAVLGSWGDKLDVVVAKPEPEPSRIVGVFLLDGPTRRTSISRCDSVAAIGHILDESPALLLDFGGAAGHLDTIRRLVESVPVRRLAPGPEVLSDPGALRVLLERSLSDE